MIFSLNRAALAVLLVAAAFLFFNYFALAQTEREVGTGTPEREVGTTGTGGGGTTGTGTVGQTVGIENPLGQGTDIAKLLDKIATFILMIAVPIAAIMVVVGGFQIMIYGSDPEKVKTGRNTILYAAVGFAIVLLAKGVTVVIKEVLSAGGGSSPPAASPAPSPSPTGGERSERGELIPQ